MTTLIPKVSLQNGGTSVTGAANRPINLKLQDIVSVKDFGAVGDGTTDDTVAIQNCIDYAIYTANCGVYIPAGNYKISATIQVGYGAVGGSVSSPFSGVQIEGAGFKFKTETGSGFSGTGIVPTFSNAPAFNVQCCRHTVIRNLGILGLNYNYIANNNLGNLNPSFNDVPVSAWVNSSLDANAFSQYAPYAAIAIDGYSGAQQSVHYPSVAYPSFLGTQTQYNKTGISSEIVLEDLYIGGFAVGVVVEPNGTDGQGEFLKLNRCFIECCQYGVSLGNTQARIFDINSCNISNVHTAFVTNVHGLQNGMPCFSVRATELDRLINVMNISTSALGGPTIFEGCYGEVVYALGYFGTTATVTCSLTMIGCTFSFGKQITAGAPQAILANPGSNSVVNIQGGWFEAFVGNLLFDTPNLRFEGCNLYLDGWTDLRKVSGALPVYNAFAIKSYGLVQSTGGYFRSSYTFNGYSVVDGSADAGATVLKNRSVSARSAPLYRFSDTVYSGGTLAAGGRDPGILNPLTAYDYVVYNGYTISWSGRTATITLGTSYSSDQYNVYGMNPGDIINYITSTQKTYTFYIRARTSNVITATLQNSFDGSGNTLVTLDNTGYLYFFIGRYYLNNQYQLGTFTSASANITAVGNSSGTFAFDGQVGDAFLADSITDAFAPVTNTRITVISSPTITMNGTASQTVTKRLPLLIQAAPSNS